MSNIRTVKKGEVVFKEGDKIQNLFLIQSGAVNLCLQRPKKNIEIGQIGVNSVLGETALIGAPTFSFAAIATVETKLLEIPLDVYKSQIEATQPPLKVLIKSLGERLRSALNDVKAARLEKDASPCPEDRVATIYGSIFHTTNHKGEKNKEGVTTIDWTLLRQYTQRVFAQSPKQVEQAITLLVKLKLAQFEMGRNPDDANAPEEIQKVKFMNLGLVENFFEFYQYYYYKPGKTDILKVEDSQVNLLKNILTCAEGATPDRSGIVTIEYAKLIERFKTEWNITLNNDHFGRLEQKGLFAKRAARADGQTVLQFELKEWQNVLFIWKVLKEIDKWNEKGFVDLNEKEEVKKSSTGPTCSKCGATTTTDAKFCSECGNKLAT